MIRTNIWKPSISLTLDELPLALDDLVGERPLLVVLEDEEVPPLDLVLLQHGLALHLHLLDLQLVHLAQQRQDLTLLVRADPPRQLLQGYVFDSLMLFSKLQSASAIWYRHPKL